MITGSSWLIPGADGPDENPPCSGELWEMKTTTADAPALEKPALLHLPCSMARGSRECQTPVGKHPGRSCSSSSPPQLLVVTSMQEGGSQYIKPAQKSNSSITLEKSPFCRKWAGRGGRAPKEIPRAQINKTKPFGAGHGHPGLSFPRCGMPRLPGAAPSYHPRSYKVHPQLDHFLGFCHERNLRITSLANLSLSVFLEFHFSSPR